MTECFNPLWGRWFAPGGRAEREGEKEGWGLPALTLGKAGAPAEHTPGYVGTVHGLLSQNCLLF